MYLFATADKHGPKINCIQLSIKIGIGRKHIFCTNIPGNSLHSIKPAKVLWIVKLVLAAYTNRSATHR